MKNVAVLSFMSIAISIIAIVLVIFEIEPLDFNLFSALITVLSVLVTCLLGWQIFSIINLNELTKEIETSKKQILYLNNNVLAQNSMAFSDFYYHLNFKDDTSRIEYNYLFYRLSSILHSSKNGDIETCNVVVKSLLEHVNPEHIFLSKDDIGNLFTVIGNIQHKNEIKRMNELIRHLAKLETD